MIVRSAPLFWIGRGLIAGVFASVCGLYAAKAGTAAWVLGTAGALLFGAMGLFAVRQLVRRSPRLILDGSGVTIGDMGVGFIPWAEIGGPELFGSAQAPMMALQVIDPGRYLARMPAWGRGLARIHRWSGLPLFSVNLIGTDWPAAAVFQEGMRCWGAVAHRER